MGKGIVDRLSKEYDIELIHRGFEIHPDVPLEGMLLEDYFPGAKNMFHNLKTMGAPYGIVFNPVTMMPNTNKALQLAEYAKTIGKSRQVMDKIFHAVFVEDINISQTAALYEIGKAVDISPEAIDAVLASSTYRHILEENKGYCHAMNISSVPTFIINDQAVIVGAQSLDRFRTLLDQLKK